LRRAVSYGFMILIIFMMGFLVQLNYFLVKPGSAEKLGNLIQVEGKQRQEQGQFYMLTVSQQPANVWGFLYGYFHPAVDLRPISQVVPSDLSMEEYNDLMKSWMQESKHLAGVIALRRAGYEVPVTSDGVEVVRVLPDSPARGVLQAGDIITAVEGEGVNLAEEVVADIQKKDVGEKVRIAFQRKEENNEAEILTVSHLEDPHQAALRLYVRTLNWKPLFPLKIEIETGPVSGPSAGMMFVLEILDRLLPENLTGGRRIGGTGTIALDGKVGGIGGVKQKVFAAERAGLEYFLVPAENYREALQVATRLEVVSVDNLEEALNFLSTLHCASEKALLSPEINRSPSFVVPLFLFFKEVQGGFQA
jgi:PDZ domain-containing protein